MPSVKSEPAEDDQTGLVQAAPTPSPSWDRNWATMCKVSPSYMEQMLKYGAPHIFTEPNLKSLRKRGGKAVPSARLLHYIEFCSNMDATTAIPPELRNQDTLLEYFRQLCIHMGKRANTTHIEQEEDAQWLQGIYSCDFKKEGKLTVQHRTIGKPKVIDIPKGKNDFYIAMNWSETRACVRSHSCDYSKQLCVVFASDISARKPFVFKPNGATRAKNECKVEAARSEENGEPSLAAEVAAPVEAAGSGVPIKPVVAPVKRAHTAHPPSFAKRSRTT